MATTDANGFITIENSDLFNISHANGNAAAASAVATRVTTAEGAISDIQTALDTKVDTSTYTAGMATKVNSSTYTSGMATKVDKVDGKGLSTEDYTTAEKTKLAGVEAGANAYTLPAATSGALGGVKQGANVSIAADGTLSATDTTYGEATTGSAGLMSAADKTKLNGIAEGANNLPFASLSNFVTSVYVSGSQATGMTSSSTAYYIGSATYSNPAVCFLCIGINGINASANDTILINLASIRVKHNVYINGYFFGDDGTVEGTYFFNTEKQIKATPSTSITKIRLNITVPIYLAS